MEIQIITDVVSKETLQKLAEAWYEDMVKGVVDLERNVVALGGEWHMDANEVLIADGSQQEHNWGFNVYPGEKGKNAIEYISLINIRPKQGNRSMEIEDNSLRDEIKEVVRAKIPFLEL